MVSPMKSGNLPNRPCYVIITPVRNEARHFEDTVKAVIQQTSPPLEWVIVDDGSSDGTEEIADRYSTLCSWITVVHRLDRGFREPGAGVVQAFYDGLAHLTRTDWEYLVKLDGDLGLPATYFENCLRKFCELPRLGVGGGTVYHVDKGIERVD